MRIAIIGAGMAGLSCGRALAGQGHSVQLFDKGRKPGGRMATREQAGFAFDHGAQFFTARNPAFRDLIRQGEQGEAVAQWAPRIRGARRGPQADDPWFVARPRMADIVATVGAGLAITASAHVTALQPSDDGWSVRFFDPGTGAAADRTAGPFDWVVLTAPAAQTAALVPEGCAFVDTLAEVAYAPCLTAMAAWTDRLPVDWDVLAESGPVIAWAARQASKPGRSPAPEAWVLHAQAGWSGDHLADDPTVIAPGLLAAFEQEIGGALPAPHHLAAHRWRYAQVVRPVGAACLIDRDRCLGACGDWCLGPRVEAAFESGTALALAISG